MANVKLRPILSGFKAETIYLCGSWNKYSVLYPLVKDGSSTEYYTWKGTFPIVLQHGQH
jgi:hypothetical protein